MDIISESCWSSGQRKSGSDGMQRASSLNHQDEEKSHREDVYECMLDMRTEESIKGI